jgi:hypothetical protein
MPENKEYTAKAGLSTIVAKGATISDYDKSVELGKILESDTVKPKTKNGEEVEGMNEVSRKFTLETPYTDKEAVSFAKANPYGSAAEIVAEKLVTKKRNEIAASMKPAENKTAALKAELEAAKSQTQRLVAAQQAGDFELVKSIIAEMS